MEPWQLRVALFALAHLLCAAGGYWLLRGMVRPRQRSWRQRDRVAALGMALFAGPLLPLLVLIRYLCVTWEDEVKW